MNDKTKILGALVLGAIAGAAIVKLLETDDGKKIVEKTKNMIKANKEDIKNKISRIENELSAILNTDKNNTSNQA